MQELNSTSPHRSATRMAHVLAIACCVSLGVLWVALFWCLSPVDAERFGLSLRDPSFASLVIRLVCYSFVHTDPAVLLLNCCVLAHLAWLHAMRSSVLELFRLFSLGGLFGGMLYLLASWLLRNDAPLSGGHTALMACCAGMAVLDPGKKIGESVQGRTVIIAAYLFLGGWCANPQNLSASFLAMLAGAGAGIAYGVISRTMERDASGGN